MNTATKNGINAAKKFGDKYGKNFVKTADKKSSSKKCRSYWRFDWIK